MMSARFARWPILLAAALGISCRPDGSGGVPARPSAAATHSYRLVGVVKKVDPDTGTVFSPSRRATR